MIEDRSGEREALKRLGMAVLLRAIADACGFFRRGELGGRDKTAVMADGRRFIEAERDSVRSFWCKVAAYDERAYLRLARDALQNGLSRRAKRAWPV